ncbi:ABC transporter ATP-binding protein [Nocardiopsis sp. RSe5-2]|uniref:ABC transporter ATP-binding protein n=1 Tax=Nocardiopsis endophytica TaxID=3018445 RepID=A0ABT4UAV5_9ACTN|nr:ABC transporter ATP-binding protein [Nocardiopsis endophytica]MDA2814027.1 ABC transporter ATP-binding protein [Nocardiopsis endophytica]
MKPVLEVEGLRVRRGASELVRGVDLRLEAGAFLGLVGASGAGKSLTALAVAGLLDDGLEAAGSVRLAGVGHDLLGAPERAMRAVRGRRIGMVFQEPMAALNPLHRVGSQVAEAVRVHAGRLGRAEARERAVGLLERMGLPRPERLARAYPHQLSGGQRQRVVLAMAVAGDPALLVCDEPATALDATVRRRVLDLIGQAARERGAAVLYISHDLREVARLCERVAVMDRGAVVESGPTAEVLEAPGHEAARVLVRAAAPRPSPASRSPYPSSPSPYSSSPSPFPSPRSPSSHSSFRSPLSSPPPPIIRAEGLTRRFRVPGTGVRPWGGSLTALDAVDLEVPEGAGFGVVGESGAGKSTLVRLLAGLDQATEGSLEVAGVRVTGATERGLRPLRRAVQVVYQDPQGSLDPRMRVGDIVAEPLVGAGVPRRERAARVAGVLEAVGLSPQDARRRPRHFSGGQRQRIAIARALAPRPRVLLADEPVSALDVSVRGQIMDLLLRLAESEGLTLVIVSHDLDVVRALCARVAIMRRGRIVETGPVERVWTHPEHEYTRELLEASRL